MSQQLWYVEHNGGTDGGRKDRVWRFAVLAASGDEAIVIAQEEHNERGGGWSAEPYGSAVAHLGLVFRDRLKKPKAPTTPPDLLHMNMRDHTRP